jgi:hypothetical protein
MDIIELIFVIVGSIMGTVQAMVCIIDHFHPTKNNRPVPDKD